MLRLSPSITTSSEIRPPSHRHNFDSKSHPGQRRKRELLEAKARRTDRPVFHLSWRKQSLRQLIDNFQAPHVSPHRLGVWGVHLE